MVQHEFWEFTVPGAASALAAIATVWLTTRSTNRKVDANTARVDEAVSLSRPTGNGFAEEVRTGLREIRAEQARQAVHLGRIDGVLSVLAPQAQTTSEGSST